MADNFSSAIEQSQTALFHNVYVPVFAKTAAALGLDVSSEQNMQDLLQLAELCRTHKQAGDSQVQTGTYSTLVKQATQAVAAPQDPAQPYVANLVANPEFQKFAADRLNLERQVVAASK